MNLEGDLGARSHDFELNLAPIIDCLTVLITFMLASVTFLAVGILDAPLANRGAAASGAKPPAVNLEVELGMHGELQVNLSGKRRMEKKINALNGTWNLPELETEVERIKQEFPDTQSIVLSAKDDVAYVQYINVMEAMKSHFPVVLMGGF